MTFLWLPSQLMILASVGVLCVIALILVVWSAARVSRVVFDRVTGRRRRHARPRWQRRTTRVDPFPDVAPLRGIEVPAKPDHPPFAAPWPGGAPTASLPKLPLEIEP